MLQIPQVPIDKFIPMGAIDHTEGFTDHYRRSHCTDKRSPDGAPGELCQAALIQP